MEHTPEEYFQKLYKEKPWLLDSIYWLETEICTEFPTLHANQISVYYGNPDGLTSEGTNYISKSDKKHQREGNVKDIYIRLSDNPQLSDLYFKVCFQRNFDENAFCYFANAICRFYNKINPKSYEVDDSIVDFLKVLSGKRLQDTIGGYEKYVMPRALRARYKFASNMAFFDFVINGNPYKDGKRTFFRNVISKLEKRAFETYEGKHRTFSCLVDAASEEISEETTSTAKLTDFLDIKESNLFANAHRTYFLVTKEGYINKYIVHNASLNADSEVESSHEVFAPSQYYSIAAACQKEIVGIVLSPQGEILVFKNQTLVLSKRKGLWHYHDQSAITNVIMSKIITEDGSYDKGLCRQLANSIYASIIDVSFSHTGGCIGIIEEGTRIVDVDFSEKDVKTKNSISPVTPVVLKRIMSQRVTGTDDRDETCSFTTVNRQIRAELLSLDGVTIVNQNSNYMAVGYILNHTMYAEGGGRKRSSC